MNQKHPKVIRKKKRNKMETSSLIQQMSCWISQEVVEVKQTQKNKKLFPIIIKRIYLSNMNKLIVQRKIICLIEQKRSLLTYIVFLQSITSITSHLCQMNHRNQHNRERLTQHCQFLVYHGAFSLKLLLNQLSQMQQHLMRLRKKLIWVLSKKI